LPNDPNFNAQWAWDNDGSSGIPDADVDATDAWNITTGGTTVTGEEIVIAIIDDGFDLNHEDLFFWSNTSEIPADGMDNDGNGYVDDVQGWDATNNDNSFPASSHGTHVTGIATAQGDNGLGIAGLSWNTAVLPVFADVNEADVVAAYSYVYKIRKTYNETGGTEGAFIVATNSSFGIDFAQPDENPIWCAMYDTLGALGILNATATANIYLDIDFFGDVPTACASDYMISVTNSGTNDAVISAGYGLTTIDLAAPGTGILSTEPGNSYGYKTGTSMSTPVAAATVALLFSAACEDFMIDYHYAPAAMALFLKDIIIQSVDPISSLADKLVSGGRLNVNEALLLLEAEYCDPLSISAEIQTDKVQLTYDSETNSWMLDLSGFSGITEIEVFNLLGQQILNKTAFEGGLHSLPVSKWQKTSSMLILQVNSIDFQQVRYFTIPVLNPN
jgi:subtilisin family serine protease